MTPESLRIALIEHFEKRYQLIVLSVNGTVCRRESIEIASQNNTRVVFWQLQDIGFQKQRFFDSSSKIGRMKMHDVEPDPLNAASKKPVMHSVHQAFYIGDRIPRRDARWKPVLLQQF